VRFKKTVATVLFASLLAACGSEEASMKPQSCLESMPNAIDGLQVTGARSEQNVIKNVWPIVCMAQHKFRERLKDNPELEGTIEVTLSVEFNGEIGSYRIVRSTLKDPVVEKQVLRLFQFKDFDPYGPQNSESDIRFPIRLEP